MRDLARTLARVGPPIAWMAVIALLSGDRFGASETGRRFLPALALVVPGAGPEMLHAAHTLLRKLGHVLEYGVLAALWLRALDPAGARPRTTRWAVGLTAAYAVLDEARQALAPDRSPSVLDVALDTAGALVAVAALGSSAASATLAVRLLWWVAVVIALGSLGSALVDWSLGLGAWDLVLAALGAGAAAAGLTRWARWARWERWWRAPT
jgi:VanZ family protein